MYLDIPRGPTPNQGQTQDISSPSSGPVIALQLKNNQNTSNHKNLSPHNLWTWLPVKQDLSFSFDLKVSKSTLSDERHYTWGGVACLICSSLCTLNVFIWLSAKKNLSQMPIDTFNQQKKSCHMGLSDCSSIYHMLTFHSAFQKRRLNIQSSSLCLHDTQAHENCRKSRNIQNTKKKCKNCNQQKDSYAHKIV